MFTGFDPALFDDPNFKEDSVREIIITPLLTRLGYSPSGADRVVRSKTLNHPFIYAGTTKYPVKIVPDYTIYNGEKALLVLDAKRPSEDILSRKHVQQAYSYAIHPEIKCQSFSLCNGKKLAVFNVDKSDPDLVVDFPFFETEWDEIERHIGPRFLKNPALRRFDPDFGSALKRLGLATSTKISIIAAQLNLFGVISDELITASACCDFAGRDHFVSFDFTPSLLPKVLSGLPSKLADEFVRALSRVPFKVAAELAIEVDIHGRLGDEIQVETESFTPIMVDDFTSSRFNHSPTQGRALDIPNGIWKLRDAYKVEIVPHPEK